MCFEEESIDHLFVHCLNGLHFMSFVIIVDGD